MSKLYKVKRTSLKTFLWKIDMYLKIALLIWILACKTCFEIKKIKAILMFNLKINLNLSKPWKLQS